MAKKMLIDATHAEETRVVVVDGNKVEEFDFESENKRQLAGNIYLAKVTRVEPSLQAAFVDYGGNRHGFLAFSEIHPDYYQIPVADREALMEEERAYAEAQRARDDDEDDPKPKRRTRSRSKTRAEKARTSDAVETRDPASSGEISGMETIDLSEDDSDLSEVPEATSPMETVAETPVEEPQDDTPEAGVDEEAVEAADEALLAEDDAEDEGDAQGETGDSSATEGKSSDAADKDDSIESVAEEDDHEDIRPPRKPRPKRYKIQEVIKVRQVLLVQVVKEERGNKGAALTTYLSLAGRYCVLMPNTARGGGISRKITNAVDRKKLKEIAAELDVPTGAGLIVRTAGAKRTKAEIKRDYEYLQRLWEQIRELTLKSIAPAKIYEEGDLIKRSIRDLYNREIDEVLVEGERGYRIAKDFMKMIMPSHAKNVKNYQDSLPLFARYQVESYLGAMFNPTVQLKSGGYIVIGVTEALVAIDVNSGRATKEASIEDTALKTNLEAAEEVARQLRLRDLAGLIVIDFIDMDERKNNAAVEKRMKDKLKTDRARIQVGRISGFGLMEMSRQRLRPGMIEATTAPCPHCHGTGLIRSDDSMALSILRQIEEEGTRRRSREVLVKCPVDIANYLMNQKREHIAQIEARYGLSVRIEGDVTLVSPDFTLEKFKTASRSIPVSTAPVVSVDTSIMDQVDAEEEVEEEAEIVAEPTPEVPEVESEADGEAKPKRKRRRRRRKKSNGDNGGEGTQDANGESEASANEADATPAAEEADEPAAETSDAEDESKKKKTRTRTRSRSRKKPEPVAEQASAVEAEAPTAEAPVEEPAAEVAAVEAESAPVVESASEDAPQVEAVEAQAEESPATEAPESAVESDAEAAPAAEAETAPVAEAAPEAASETAEAPSAEAPAEDATAQEAPEVSAAEPMTEEAASETATESAPEPEAELVTAEPEPAEPAKPKRRGWWSVGS
ncbi:ribonuclease E/G [Phaeobacter sp. HF9A]|uniref:Rne/Rng family ribonuclease n=1 Tax=Phaeobacter sp. HF9A TaxID=2721561 RepID=UPI00142F8706|nr:ribonuclease E/G [Phaeobacter sp. HF9A]NIZ13860.1 Rne/Rng family ribonuclease [Phaeobacter sp. HF9A]